MEWLNAENVSILLFFIGLSGIIYRKNMMITVLSMGIMDSGIILFFLSFNADVERNVPLATNYLPKMVDPIPHALMITSIVIGVAITAIVLIMVIEFYNKYKTLDWDVARKIREEEKWSI